MTTETTVPVNSYQEASAEKTAAKTLLQRSEAKLKDMFTGDNLFGSATIAAYLYPQWKTISGGKARRDIAGRPAADKWRMGSSAFDVFSNAGLFLSDRGAEAPEGHNVVTRIKNTLLHPNISSVYFYRLTQVPVQVLSIIANVQKGMEAMKEGGRKSERIRLLSAAVTAVGSFLYFTGMFGSQTERTSSKTEPSSDNRSLSNKTEEVLYPADVVKSAFRRYPRLIMAAVTDVLVDLSLLTEAVLVNRESAAGQKRSSGELAKAAAANIALDSSINYYTWAQMVKESRNPAENIKSQVK
ncbi:MAG TPA: hypothetical protein VFT64_12510 [Rickettsiales bacterium]|nr:hypothetical protein [Rickettsiales bacterium]